MIVRLNNHGDFAERLAYVTGQPGAERIGGNMAGREPRELLAEFRLIAAVHPARSRTACHFSARVAPGESLTDARWCAAVERLLLGMGLARCPFVIYRHTDSGAGHVHVIVATISFVGESLPINQLPARAYRVKARLERDYGLRPAPSIGVSALSAQEAHLPTVPGDPPLRRRLQAAIAEAAGAAAGFQGFLAKLERRGVSAQPLLTAQAALRGMTFRLAGTRYEYGASRLGPLFAWRTIERTFALDFQPVRDLPAALAARDRFLAGRAPEADLRRATHAPARRRAAVRERGAARRRGVTTTRGTLIQVTASLATTAAARRLAAWPAPAAARSGLSEPPSSVWPDTAAARRQLTVLASPRFDFLVVEAESGRTVEHRLDCAMEGLLAELPRLARAGQEGAEVLVRPAAEAGLHLLVVTHKEYVSRARRAGFEPAAVVATSSEGAAPREVWLRAAPGEPLTAAEREVFETALARRLCGRLVSAGRGFGHLAGFPSPLTRRLEGGSEVPVMRLLSAEGVVFSRARELAAAARAENRRREVEARVRAEIAALGIGQPGSGGAAGAAWQEALRGLAERCADHRLAVHLPPATDAAAVEETVLRLAMARDSYAHARAALAARSARAAVPGGEAARQTVGIERIVESHRRVSAAERTVEDLLGLAPLPAALRLEEIGGHSRRREVALAAAARWQSALADPGATAPDRLEAAAAYRSLRREVEDSERERGLRSSLPPELPPVPSLVVAANHGAPYGLAAAAARAAPEGAVREGSLPERHRPEPRGQAGRAIGQAALAGRSFAGAVADHRRASRRLASLIQESRRPPRATAGRRDPDRLPAPRREAPEVIAERRLRAAAGARASAELALETHEARLLSAARRLAAARDLLATEVTRRATAPAALDRPQALAADAAGRPAHLTRPETVAAELTGRGAAAGLVRHEGVPPDLGGGRREAAAASAANDLRLRPWLHAVSVVEARLDDLARQLDGLARLRAGRDAESRGGGLLVSITPAGHGERQAGQAERLAAHAERRAEQAEREPAQALRRARGGVRRAGRDLGDEMQLATAAVEPRDRTLAAPAAGLPAPPAAMLPPTERARVLHAALARQAAAEEALALRLAVQAGPGAPTELPPAERATGLPPRLAVLLCRVGRGDLTAETMARLRRDLVLARTATTVPAAPPAGSSSRQTAGPSPDLHAGPAPSLVAGALSKRQASPILAAGALSKRQARSPGSQRSPSPDLATECSPGVPGDPPAGLVASLAAYRAARASLLRSARVATHRPPAAPAALAAAPAALDELHTAVARFQAAGAELHRRLGAAVLDARGVLPLAAFADHPACERAPHRAVLAWSAHAARQGLPVEQVRALLTHAAPSLLANPSAFSPRFIHLAAGLGADLSRRLARAAVREPASLAR